MLTPDFITVKHSNRDVVRLMTSLRMQCTKAHMVDRLWIDLRKGLIGHSAQISSLSWIEILNLELLFRQPIMTGTSVLAIKYKDGIMMAADTLGSQHPARLNPALF